MFRKRTFWLSTLENLSTNSRYKHAGRQLFLWEIPRNCTVILCLAYWMLTVGLFLISNDDTQPRKLSGESR